MSAAKKFASITCIAIMPLVLHDVANACVSVRYVDDFHYKEITNDCHYPVAVWVCGLGDPLGTYRVSQGRSASTNIGSSQQTSMIAWCEDINGVPSCSPPRPSELGCR